MGGPLARWGQIGETSFLLFRGSRELRARVSMIQDSYDGGFAAPIAALSYIGFSKRAKIGENKGLPEFASVCFLKHRVSEGEYQFLTSRRGTERKMTPGSAEVISSTGIPRIWSSTPKSGG